MKHTWVQSLEGRRLEGCMPPLGLPLASRRSAARRRGVRTASICSEALVVSVVISTPQLASSAALAAGRKGGREGGGTGMFGAVSRLHRHQCFLASCSCMRAGARGEAQALPRATHPRPCSAAAWAAAAASSGRSLPAVHASCKRWRWKHTALPSAGQQCPGAEHVSTSLPTEATTAPRPAKASAATAGSPRRTPPVGRLCSPLPPHLLTTSSMYAMSASACSLLQPSTGAG